jgi:hypothetical protein
MIFDEIFSWIWIVSSVLMAGPFLLFEWQPGEVTTTKTVFVDGKRQESTVTRPGTWRDLFWQKSIALMFLAGAYLTLDHLFGNQWGPIGGRIAETMIGVVFASMALIFSWFLISSRQGMQEWAHTRQPRADLAAEALAEGPDEAIVSSVRTALARVILRLPFGWLVPALLPATFAVLILIGVRNVWTSDSALQWAAAPAGGRGNQYATAVFEHVAFYLFWGGLLAGALAGTVANLFNPKSGAPRLLGLAALSAAALGIYIVFEGIWP